MTNAESLIIALLIILTTVITNAISYWRGAKMAYEDARSMVRESNEELYANLERLNNEKGGAEDSMRGRVCLPGSDVLDPNELSRRNREAGEHHNGNSGRGIQQTPKDDSGIPPV